MFVASLLLFVMSTMDIAAGAGNKAPKTDDPIIVVGGGLAGLSAAISALDRGASKVYILDKEKNLGGNSAKATSGINACGTSAQKEAGIRDTVEKFYADTMSAGDRDNDAKLVDVLVEHSADAVQFLINKGVDLGAVNLCGGHSVPRTHWLPSPKEGKPLPVGVAIMRTLEKYLREYSEKNPEKLEIRLETPVVGLVTWNDFITGIRYKNSSGFIEELSGKAVILTTGGYSADRDNTTSLLGLHANHLLSLPTTNGQFATGDGVKMASAMGAEIIGMENVQVHPTAFVDPKQPNAMTKFLAAEALRGKGALLINQNGERFANELGRRDYLTQKMNTLCEKDSNGWPIAFMILNDKMADAFGRPSFNFYANIKGFFEKFENAQTMADALKFDFGKLKKAISENNGFVENGGSDQFEKNVFPAKIELDEPIYVARVTPAIHYTMGGLKIDRDGFAFSEFMQKPFRGLLAAGEVTGGVHGRNRLAGNSLLECVVFGRIAGRSAANINYSSKEEL